MSRNKTVYRDAMTTAWQISPANKNAGGQFEFYGERLICVYKKKKTLIVNSELIIYDANVKSFEDEKPSINEVQTHSCYVIEKTGITKQVQVKFSLHFSQSYFLPLF